MDQKRFLYSASAVAVAAKFDGANALNRSWATVSLPIIGGEVLAAEDGPIGNPVLSFGRATAHVNGFERPTDTFNTVNRVTVTNLNVLGRLLADTIDVSLTFVFQRAGESITDVQISGTPYVNLPTSISGSTVRTFPTSHMPRTFRWWRARTIRNSGK
jgi:hypothetical protein